MKADGRAIATLFRTELRMLLRDRRTVVTSIALPLLVMPLMLFASHWMEQRRQRALEGTEYLFAVTGPRAQFARALIAQVGARRDREGRTSKTSFRYREVQVAEPAQALAKGDVQFYLETSTGEGHSAPTPEENVRDDDRSREPDGADRRETVQPGEPVVAVVFRGDRDDSQAGAEKMAVLLRDAREERRDLLLKEHGSPASSASLAATSTREVATAGHVAGLTLGRVITLMLLVFVLSGGAVVATDTLAGEKERGTLETLLTTAVGRLEIVVAKQLAILAVALVITLIQVANLLVYVGFRLIPATADFAAAVPPQVALLLLLLFLPVAALASSVLLLTSGYARSYKEAQLYFFPVFFLGMVPALAPFLPGLSLRSIVVVVPVADIAVAVKEVLIGHFDWPMIALSWLVTSAAAVLVAWLAVRTLSAERLVTAADTDAVEFRGGPALFERRVLAWFAVMWAVMLVLASHLTDIRAQLAVNLIVIFLGGSWLMIRIYRLDPRQALALRPVHPVAWLAVVIGAPAGLLTAVGVFRLASLVIPVPAKLLESFDRALLPAGIPFWQVLVLLSVLPAICEEIAFRGLLLHGLHRRLRPAAVVVVVGAVFALFHVALFRLAPTAFLGLILASVTLLTGSIFPAMLWHGLNNLLGLLAGRADLPLSGLDADFYLAGAAILAAAFWLLWRTRRPYPGLRSRRRPR
ncbi:MAG: ABC transporter permease subunit [Acidobacteriota bacterium]